jgi:phosphoserine phosphatase
MANKRHLRYKNSAGLPLLALRCFQQDIFFRISPAGRQTVTEHRHRGRLVVLFAGSLQPLTELLAEELGADLALAVGQAEEG